VVPVGMFPAVELVPLWVPWPRVPVVGGGCRSMVWVWFSAMTVPVILLSPVLDRPWNPWEFLENTLVDLVGFGRCDSWMEA
jgi:hypothetical protein